MNKYTFRIKCLKQADCIYSCLAETKEQAVEKLNKKFGAFTDDPNNKILRIVPIAIEKNVLETSLVEKEAVRRAKATKNLNPLDFNTYTHHLKGGSRAGRSKKNAP